MLGFALFAAYVTRLNGYTLLIVLAIGQAARLCKASDRRTYLKTAWIPYGVFLLLLGVSCLFLPMATSNHSDFAKSTIEAIAKNYEAFDEWMGEWFAAMAFDRMKQAWFLRVLVYLTMFVGMWKRGGIEELHLSVLCVGTLVVTNLLPYAASEGIRYYFTMLPLMLLFLVEGVSVWGGWSSCLPSQKSRFSWRKMVYILLTCMACFCAAKQIGQKRNSIDLRYVDYATFRGDMPELYAYIRDELPENAQIAYWKPRGMNLLTGRIAFRPGINGHKLSDADYFVEIYLPSTPKDDFQKRIFDGCLIEPWRNGEYWIMYTVTEVED